MHGIFIICLIDANLNYNQLSGADERIRGMMSNTAGVEMTEFHVILKNHFKDLRYFLSAALKSVAPVAKSACEPRFTIQLCATCRRLSTPGLKLLLLV